MAILNQFKTAVLLGLLTGLLLAVGYLIGGTNGLTIALVISLLMNFGSYFFSDRIVLAIYRAKEIKEKDNPELYRIVSDVANRAGMPMPKVCTIPTSTPNAFATGRNPKHSAVACTEGILGLLSKEELKGVVAHEMSHIKNRDTLIQTIAATIAGVITYAAMMARFAAMFGGGSRDREGNDLLYLIVLGVLTPFIAMLLQLALSRSREYLADETGARMIHDPVSLANALQKLHSGVKHDPMQFGTPSTSSLFIVNPFSMKGFSSLMMTHPPMEERIKRLKSMKIQ